MKIKTKSRITVFILALICWLALTSFSDLQELVAGIIVSLVVSLIAGHFLITTGMSGGTFRRIMVFIKYIFVFTLEMIKANLHVAYIVIHPLLPIKPGIVKIRTTLKKDSARTVLADSITLTPGTMTVDINADNGDIYIHWIDIKSADPKDVKENTKNISDVFEKYLTEVYE